VTLRVHPDEIVESSSSPLLRMHPTWERVRLGDIADVLNGFAFASTGFSHDRGMPLIRIRDVRSETTQIRYAGEFDTHYIVEPRTILVGMDGDFRAARWRGEPALLNQRVCTIKVRDPAFYDENFLLRALPGYLDAIHGATSSITVKHLSSETIKQIPLPLPPLAEQRRIVAAIEEHLSRLDVAVELLRNAAARLEGLRGAIIDSAFVDGWPRVPLGEIAEVVGGVTKDSKRQQEPGLVEVPYLRVANVQRGFLDLETIVTIRVSPESAAKLELRPGDVLFNEGGDRDKLGRGWVWSGEIPGCIHQNHVFRARFRDGFDPRFVSWWGNSFGREWFWRHGRQTTNLASMSLSTLKAFPVPAPPLDEQRAAVDEIARGLSAVDHLVQVVGGAQARADALRRSILARAFRGELVPQHMNDERPSVLLERIAAEPVASPAATRKRRMRTLA
jgi:type I restriction enzyme, S subunit